MSLNVRLARTFPGFGVGVSNDSVYYQAGVALSGTTAQTTAHPASSVLLAPPTTCGKFRIKIYNFGGTTPTVLAVNVFATDGTNSVLIYDDFVPTNTGMTLAGATTKWYDKMFDYVIDTAASGAGGGATGQLSGTVGGATYFNVLTILGGTSPTASMDLEIVPLI